MFPVLKAEGDSAILQKRQTKPEMALIENPCPQWKDCLYPGHNSGKQGETGSHLTASSARHLPDIPRYLQFPG